MTTHCLSCGLLADALVHHAEVNGHPFTATEAELDRRAALSGEQEPITYNETRFACHCGRFLSDAAIRHADHRDDSRYYGVRTEVEWDCGRCGTIKGEEWEPQIVITATRVLPPASTEVRDV